MRHTHRLSQGEALIGNVFFFLQCLFGSVFFILQKAVFQKEKCVLTVTLVWAHTQRTLQVAVSLSQARS